MPEEEKTIKTMDVGGTAGGIKYSCQGILFKFAVDNENKRRKGGPYVYGGDSKLDHAAAKAAAHELKALISYFNTTLVAPDLHFPLQALIDYRGFRLIAMPWLPITKSTIAYGSDDGGKTAHADIGELNELMKRAGKYLRLKPHLVESKVLYAPGDIEGHRGKV